MEMTIQVDEGTGPDLYQWLISDPDVLRHIRVAPADDGPDGAMGTGFDLLNLAVSSAIGLSSLGVAIAAFVDQRRSGGREPRIEVRQETRFVLLGVDADETLRRIFQTELPPQDGTQPGHGTAGDR